MTTDNPTVMVTVYGKPKKKKTSDVLAAFPRGWHVASARHVDIIVCSPDVKVREHGYRLDGVKGVISDHPMVTATVAVPVKKECK